MHPPEAANRSSSSSTRRNPAADEAGPHASIGELLGPLVEQSRGPGAVLEYTAPGRFQDGGRSYHLPRFVFRGGRADWEPIRIGIFAAIHGDEPESARALREFILGLVKDPAPAHGYELHAYPLCNPTGFEDGSRLSRAGRDLNREFWRGSREPEVQCLERELGIVRFHGVVALHADDTVNGVYAYARGATLTETLAEPALAAAEAFLPRADGEIIDGFPACRGIIKHCYEGVLSDPRELHPAPFEIIFETPQRAAEHLQIAASVAALRAILREYRGLLAYGQDL